MKSFRVERGRKAVAVCLITFLSLSRPGPPLFAQEGHPAEEPNGSISANRFYFDFKGTKLIQVLTILSQLSGINFVVGKEVADREVNMVLDNVTLEDTLEALTRGSNVVYDFIPQKNIYLFRAAADAENLPPLVTRVFKLYYVLASPLREIAGGEGTSGGTSSTTSSAFGTLSETNESSKTGTSSPILTVVQSMLSERGKVNVDDRSNSLIVTDMEDRLQMVEQVIAQLDRKLDQILIEVILIETFEDLDRHLGIEWSSAASEGTFGTVKGGIARTRFPFNLKYPLSGSEVFGKGDVTREEVATALPTATTFGTKDFSTFTSTLKALQIASKLRILAKPKILVLDNHPALVKITTNSAVGQNTVATATGQLTSASTTTTERTETGTSLRLTPHINMKDQITMTIEPRFVTVASSSILSSTADPTIRTARTTLMVRDGQTIAIGGLLSSQQTNVNRKVPLLGDIPIFGEALTKRTKTIDDRELVLFITPHIIRDPAELQPPSVPDQRERMDEATRPFWKKGQKRPARFSQGSKGEPPEPQNPKSAKKRKRAVDDAIKKVSSLEQSLNDKKLMPPDTPKKALPH